MMLKTLPLFEPSGQVAFRECGTIHAGKSAPLVLIHGVGMHSAAWEPQIKSLSQTHHVVALDMPGHGGSSPLQPEANLPDFVAWLRAVLDVFSFDRVNLAGHSMGALISGGFTIAHGDRLERVALLNGVFCREVSARKAVVARAQLIRSGSFDVEAPINRWFRDAPTQQAARNKVATLLSEVNIDSYATAYTAFATGDDIYAGDYTKISCPFLAMTGDLDLNSTPAMSRKMAGMVKNGHAIILKGHGHMMNLTAPGEVNAALQGWLSTSISSQGHSKAMRYEHN